MKPALLLLLAASLVADRGVNAGDRTGLVVMGADYAYLAVTRAAAGLSVQQEVCAAADAGRAEQSTEGVAVRKSTLYFRLRVTEGARCAFSYSTDGTAFTGLGGEFTAKPGRWIGAKVGLFATRRTAGGEGGCADYDWFRVEGAR